MHWLLLVRAIVADYLHCAAFVPTGVDDARRVVAEWCDAEAMSRLPRHQADATNEALVPVAVSYAFVAVVVGIAAVVVASAVDVAVVGDIVDVKVDSVAHEEVPQCYCLPWDQTLK